MSAVAKILDDDGNVIIDEQGRVAGAIDPSPMDRIYGWKVIARALGMSRQSAQRAADPTLAAMKRKPPLPVWQDHRGEVFISRFDLQCWIRAQTHAWRGPRERS